MDGAPAPPVNPLEPDETSGFAVWALAFGISAVALIATSAFGESADVRGTLGLLLLSPLATVFGITGIVRCRHRRRRGRWMAVVGLLLGLAPWVLLILLVILLAASCGDHCFVN